MELVCLDELVPDEHILRKVNRAVDFEFIREKTAHLYCHDNGRPAVDPVILFKMLFIGYLFGIRSERQLVKEIQVNVAYRWFLGFDFTTKVPDASTISQNRRRRFSDSTIYQDIFDEIVLFAMKKRLVDGQRLYTDSTHLKASANKNKFVLAEVQKSTRSYLDELEQDVTEDRAAHGKKPLKAQEREVELKEIKQSTTDPESGFMVRDGKPRGFFTSTIAQWTESWPSLQTPMSLLPTSMTASPILPALIGNESVLILLSKPWGLMLDTIPLQSVKDLKIETSSVWWLITAVSLSRGVWRNVSIVMMPMLTAISVPITANCATGQPSVAATGCMSPTLPTAVFVLCYPRVQQAPCNKKHSPGMSGRRIGSVRGTTA